MTKVDVSINGTSYVWFRYTEPLEILNAEDVNHAYQNIYVVHTALTEKGYSLDRLDPVNAEYSTELVKIIDKLNGIEYNLDILNKEKIWSIFYGSPVKKTQYSLAHNREEIWRWFQVLEDMLEIALNLKPQWGVLLCSNGYPTINGKKIVVRGDYIG